MSHVVRISSCSSGRVRRIAASESPSSVAATIATQTIVRGTGLRRWSVTVCCWVASADVEEDGQVTALELRALVSHAPQLDGAGVQIVDRVASAHVPALRQADAARVDEPERILRQGNQLRRALNDLPVPRDLDRELAVDVAREVDLELRIVVVQREKLLVKVLGQLELDHQVAERRVDEQE